MTRESPTAAAGPMIERIERIVEELGRNGGQFRIKLVLKRLNQWPPLGAAVRAVSREYGQIGLPSCVTLGERDFIRYVLNAAHPRIPVTPKYQGLPVQGETERLYKASQYVTATEIRNLVVPMLRRIGAQQAEIQIRLRHADLLDEHHLDCLGQLLLPEFEHLLDVEAVAV